MSVTKLSLVLLLILVRSVCMAQDVQVYGQINDSTDNTPLIGVYVLFYPTSDTANWTVASTDLSGNFFFNGVKPGYYQFRTSYLGYKAFEKKFIVTNSNISFGTIKLQSAANTLNGVVIKAIETHVEQKEDTTEYHAMAYKTNPDATTEDLINKMPGIQSTNGKITVNGEQVTQVLVDGKPFFGDDPNLAIKNLPAEVVDKIQVFDQLSDQAQFTGFDDGNTQKTINIITKPGMHNGQFGRIYAGYGTDGRYLVGGNLNFFDNNRRISIIGIADNVNQQNFSTQDLLGVLGGSGGGGGGGARGGFGRSGIGYGGGFSGGSGGGLSNSGVSNFLVGTQNGITTTDAFGINYSDQWGKKIKVTASLFYNNAINSDSSRLTNNYVATGADSGEVYNQTSNTGNRNYNTRLNVRLQYNIDSFNAIIFVPKVSFQKTDLTSELTGSTFLGSELENSTQSNTPSNNSGYDFSQNLLYMHKFKKKGRTISLNFGSDVNNKIANGNLFSLNQIALNDTTFQSQVLNELYNQTTSGQTFSASVNYTEPLSSTSILQFNYSPSVSKNYTNKETYDTTVENPFYLDTLLSNKFNDTYFTDRGGVSYRLNGPKQKYFLTIGANLQDATLTGTQQYPDSMGIEKNYLNILPQVILNYRFTKAKNLRIMFRTSITAPTIAQLQNVVDNNNPLLLNTGNPLLRQDYESSFITRYGATNAKKATTFLVYLYANYIKNYIGNANFIPTKDTIVNSYVINKGDQITLPVNLNGYFNSKAFVTFGFPVTFIKSNLNLNSGVTYTNTPGIINNDLNYAGNYALNQGIVLGSNISPKVDFTLSYNGSYNIIRNSLETQTNENYYNHSAYLKFNWITKHGIVFNTQLTETLYSGLGPGYDENIWIWNASIGDKILKNQVLEISISGNDILKENKSVTRTVTDTYVQDNQTQVLTRYFMLNITYTLKNFKK